MDVTKMTNTFFRYSFLLVLTAGSIFFFGSSKIAAAPIPPGCPGGPAGPAIPGTCESIPAGCPGSVQQGPRNPSVSCPYEADAPQTGPSSTSGLAPVSKDCTPAKGQKLNKDNCGIIRFIIVITNVLSGLVGVILVIWITVGGIQYSMAAGNPAAVSAARKKIFNAVTALVLYIFGFALLQYLIPGGVF